MDRNDLLTSTRVEFLRAFSVALNELVPLCVQRLYELADHAQSSRDQRRYFEARNVLTSRSASVIQSATGSMEQLLNRGFRTAYSTFRPSFPSSFSTGGGGLSLVDSSAFEGELRIDQLTERYRNAAEEQLRDLNIRVALLFDQENIKERENPFRPYLFSRSVVTSIEQLALEPELAETLIEELTDGLVGRVATIYLRLNELLADHGIAVQLKPRLPQQSAPGRNGAGSYETPDELEDEADAAYLAAERGPASVPGGLPQGGHARFGNGQQDQGSHARFGNEQPGNGHAPLGEMVASPAVPGRFDRLMQMVRGRPDPLLDAQGPASGFGGQAGPVGGGGTANEQGGELGPVSSARNRGLSEIARAGWLAGTEMVGNAMRKFFATGSAPGMPTTPLGGDTMARRVLTTSVSNLQRESTPAVEAMYDEEGQVRNLILEQHGKLTEMAPGVNEQMTIDIVAMLFEFILRDDQVPAEVRAQLGRLQFLVLKIALMDPELFTQKHHPARVLVNRIGSISVGLEKAGANTEAMVAEIRQIIERLLADERESVGLFSRMLDEFDLFIAKQLRAADEKVERAVQVLEKAENRTLQFARTTAMIAEALEGLTLDPFLQDFLLNGWAHAIERAGRDDAARAERYRMLIPDLIWSIAPKTSKQDRDQLLVQIPTMLRTLREGFELIGWDAVQQQALHTWLIEAHTHALRTATSPVPVPSLDLMRERFKPVPTADMETSTVTSTPKINRGPLNRQVLNETIKELEVELNLLDRVLGPVDDVLPAPERNLLEASGARGEEAPMVEQPQSDGEVLERLRSGVSVEINLDGKPSLARLNWISPNESSLVLSIDGDHKPAIVSVRLFLRLLTNGRARFIEVAPLFERAVQSLLQSADHVDKTGRPNLAAAPA
ncbi:DUF1631 family protein [Chitinimonas sp.]|uniref:DUF1631 family protein n=1 Tax=Chitinimonas sp. TaxID=1934313 RepID=UPI002F941990